MTFKYPSRLTPAQVYQMLNRHGQKLYNQAMQLKDCPMRRELVKDWQLIDERLEELESRYSAKELTSRQ